jgi:hypothetical protein
MASLIRRHTVWKTPEKKMGRKKPIRLEQERASDSLYGKQE